MISDKKSLYLENNKEINFIKYNRAQYRGLVKKRKF